MDMAVAVAWQARRRVSPRPWVGAVIVPTGAHQPQVFTGATQGRRGPHAEVVALRAAGERAWGSTLYCTLEPCSHHGLTPPCAEAIADSGVARVVIGVMDPDDNVAGQGVAFLRRHGVSVEVGVRSPEVTTQLEPYLHHRRTGRPWVVLKAALTADGRTAAPDGTSQWITCPEARADAHNLRADSDAIIVGAATVRADNPSLTVRLPGWEGAGGAVCNDVGLRVVSDDPDDPDDGLRQPLRVVLGQAPEGASVHPCVERTGDPATVLDELGERGVIQVLVEGGATVARDFHAAGLVDRYVLYVAPAFMGGSDAPGVFTGDGAPTIGDVWRGDVVNVGVVGADVRIDLAPRHA